MKPYIFLALCLLVSSSMVSGQSCEDRYKDKLEPHAKLIKCGANFTIERTLQSTYILKRYYPETKQITFLATSKSRKFKKLHGLYEERWDDGTIVHAGMYADNIKVGQWREHVNKIGFYNEGFRHGEWKTYDKDTLIIEREHFMNGVRHGERILLDSLGEITLKESYALGELVSSSADSTSITKDEMPRFPGCEDKNLEAEALQKCSTNKMLQFVYRNLKYPRQARKMDIQGKAQVRFIVDVDGSIIDIKMLNGVSKDITDEVLSLINKMPKWEPGRRNGEPVPVQYTLPIDFKLD